MLESVTLKTIKQSMCRAVQPTGGGGFIHRCVVVVTVASCLTLPAGFVRQELKPLSSSCFQPVASKITAAQEGAGVLTPLHGGFYRRGEAFSGIMRTILTHRTP